MATEIAKNDSYVLSSMSSAHFEGIPSIQNCLNVDEITEELWHRLSKADPSSLWTGIKR